MNSRSASLLSRFALTVVAVSGVMIAAPASAQSSILAEVYGRGVHAYNAGNYASAYELLSMAIDNGIQDPRAHYFRGFAADASGRSYEAEADFQAGAELEARGAFGTSIGRSLSRIQGHRRLQLESIREKARLQALALKMSRSKIRYGELGVQPPGMDPVVQPRVMPPRAGDPMVPPSPADDNPFADDLGVAPVVESDDALKGAMDDPLATAPDAGAVPTTPPANDPFAPKTSDPFAQPPAGGTDPFGADPGGAMDDPFGSDPFGS